MRLLCSSRRTIEIRIVGLLGPRYDDVIEVVLPEETLKRAMVRYGMNLVYLSVMISLITAALVYFAISALLVRPMMRISRSMLSFGEKPGGFQPHHHAVRTCG